MPIQVLKLRVRFIVEPDEDGSFHSYCPDLKGLHASGETEEEALRYARDAAEAYISSLLKHQDPIPVGMVQCSEEWPSLWHLFRAKARRWLLRQSRRSVVQEVTYCTTSA